MTTLDEFDLREAAEVVGLAPSTLRRHIHSGRLRARRRAGPFGHELQIARADLAAFVQARRAAGFVSDHPGARPVASVTLGELLRWAEQPAVRLAWLAWARSTSTITPGTVLTWISEQLGADMVAGR